LVMLDAVKGLKTEYTIERDDGHIEPDDTASYVKPYEEWGEREHEALSHVRGRVLDIGCGAGRVAVYLQRQGHEVTGIDISPGAVEAAGLNGLKDARLMSAEDLRFAEEKYDTVLMFGNNFGILGAGERTVKMLERLYEVTTDDALILAESVDAVKTDNPVHLAYHSRNRERGRPPGLVRIRVVYKDQKDDWLDLWLASPQEMTECAEQAGWCFAEKIGVNSLYIGLLKKK
jgi:SAM-dependent methyltransferase